MPADEEVEEGVRALLERFRLGYESEDVEAVIATMATDGDVQIVGSGIDEIRIGLAAARHQLERDFSSVDHLRIRFEDLQVSCSASGEIAWMLATNLITGTSADGQPVAAQGRMTAVCEKGADGWRFRQSHFSIPMAVTPRGETAPFS